jgi:arylsulfatase A-like enzyme
MGYHHLLLKGNYLYDPLAKVPLIIKAAGAPRPGRKKALVNNVDVTTTIIRAAGSNPVEAMSGRDLLLNFPEVPYVFSEARDGRQAMARSADSKLLLGDGVGIPHFYDLERDPFEQVNRYESPDCRNRIEAMRQAILAWRPFDNLPETSLDENAPVINRTNVPDRNDDHRRDMQEYFRSKLTAYLR